MKGGSDQIGGHRFNPTILREYDIRGVVGDTLGEADASAIGRAFARILSERGGRRVAVGYDGRLSSPALAAALIDGLTKSGASVVDVGLGPTPMLYFAAFTLDVDAGIMITGSHNPADYNGFKMMIDKKPFYGPDIQRLGEVAAAGDFIAGAGTVEARSVSAAEIERMGGKPLMWRTGHSLIKTKMAETGAPLAGEMSGHIFFADRYYGYDDALYAAVRLLGVIGRGTADLATLRDRLPAVVNTPELRFPCSETRKFAVIDEVKRRLRQAAAEMSDIDGVRVRTPDGWWLLRASNTQDVLVARAEARDDAGLGRLKALLVKELALSGLTPPPF